MTEVASKNERELIITRMIDAPPEKVWRAWTEPALLTQWFTPPPFTTPSAELDVRPGGSNVTATDQLEAVVARL